MSLVNAASDTEHTVDELPYGVALYNFFQDKYFSSITDILVARKNQTIVDENKTAELLLGSLYLSYGLKNQAHDIFKDITLNEAQDIPQTIIDQTLFHIGKDYYVDGLEENSKQALLSIDSNKDSTLSPRHESERLNILSKIYIHGGQYDDVEQTLDAFPSDSIWKPYAQFNLGVDLIKNDRLDEGLSLLESLANSAPPNKELGVLYDQANLALAATHAKSGNPDLAIKYFENIKLRNPQSNSALLGLGWMKFKSASYQDALRTWLELTKRSKSNTDVQEALMLIPYVLEKNGEKAKALNQYDLAIETYAQQLRNVEKIKAYIGQGEVIRILKSTAMNEGSLQSHDVIKMMGPELSDYLFELIASTDFKHAVNRYRELATLTNSLSQWEQTIPSLNLMLDERINAYNSRLAVVVNSSKFETARKFHNQRTRLAEQLEKVSPFNATEILATKDELELLSVLDKVKVSLDRVDSGDPDILELKSKYRFLAGIVQWNINTDYAPRLWSVKESLNELDDALQEVNRAIESLTSVWNTAPAEHQGFREKIKGKEEHIEALKREVVQAMSTQEEKVQLMAETAIEQYRVYLKKYHDRALFSKARMYDSMVLKN